MSDAVAAGKEPAEEAATVRGVMGVRSLLGEPSNREAAGWGIGPGT
jgi:hypothetical protein